MQNGQGFALVYSITNRPTFDFIDKLRDQILDFQPPDVPMVLVGNKLDLEEKRKVSQDIAQKKAKEWEIPFIEVSAKVDVNIAEIFHLLIDLCWDREGGPPQPKTQKSRCDLL
jgi:GTPase SAR1 family protein